MTEEGKSFYRKVVDIAYKRMEQDEKEELARDLIGELWPGKHLHENPPKGSRKKETTI